GALDLHLGQRGPEDIAIAVHVNGGMAVLAEHPTRGVFGSTLPLVVQIIFDKDILFRVEFGLTLPFLIEGGSIGKLHQSLKADANPLSP
ncbi:MAG: hypothetical protein GWN33_03980, partial [Gammaproteobacteria bacterium]|nr:hypothetical protein [Gammaproteobacteria bacterium]